MFNCLQQRTLSSLELPRAVVAGLPSAPQSLVESPSQEHQEKAVGEFHGESSSTFQYGGRQRQKVHDPARDISIQVLEKFSLVTKFARETSQLFRETHSNGYGSFERKRNSQSAIDYTQKEADPAKKVPNQSFFPSDPLEVALLSKYFFNYYCF